MKYQSTREQKQRVYDLSKKLESDADRAEFLSLTYRVYIDDTFKLTKRDFFKMSPAERLFFESGLYKEMKADRNRTDRYNQYNGNGD